MYRWIRSVSMILSMLLLAGCMRPESWNPVYADIDEISLQDICPKTNFSRTDISGIGATNTRKQTVLDALSSLRFRSMTKAEDQELNQAKETYWRESKAVVPSIRLYKTNIDTDDGYSSLWVYLHEDNVYVYWCGWNANGTAYTPYVCSSADTYDELLNQYNEVLDEYRTKKEKEKAEASAQP